MASIAQIGKPLATHNAETKAHSDLVLQEVRSKAKIELYMSELELAHSIDRLVDIFTKE
mgnify:CR=1 FL=1